MERADETPQFSGEYPALSRWLTGARADHPFDPARMPEPHGPLIARALDDVLADLDNANPKGISDKRSAFKQESHSGLHNLRVELLGGSLLARSGIDFEFGDPHPDLVCQCGAVEIGVEVATRSRDGVRTVGEQVEDGLAEAGLDAFVTLEFNAAPLGIREDDVAAITAAVLEAAATGEPAVRDFLNGNLRMTLRPGAGMPAVRVQYNRGGLLGPHFAQVEQEILNKVEEKRRQARCMPTALLVDFSRLGLAWLRPLKVWQARLAGEIFQPSSEFVGLAVGYSDLTTTTFQGTATWRDDLPQDQAAVVRHVLTTLAPN